METYQKFKSHFYLYPSSSCCLNFFFSFLMLLDFFPNNLQDLWRIIKLALINKHILQIELFELSLVF